MLDCFPCFKKSEEENINNVPVPVAHPVSIGTCPPRQPTGNNHVSDGSQNHIANNVDSPDIQGRSFTFRELATATKNFRQETFIGECASGRIYKGTLHSTGEVVSVKRLDKNRTDGNKEFLVEVHMLSLLRHSNLLNLVGYCADGDQRLLVYEFMPMGSVERRLFDMDAEKKPLDWSTRMKIACGTAQGIEYLHNKAKPPIIYRDLKCSNIMLDDEFNPKLSDYGLSKLAANNMSHMTVMGNQGYSAPEYEKHGEVTMKSDVYSFGVVLLELISGRRALDTSKPAEEQHLVAWAQPIFRNPKRFPEMADPRLNNSYPVKSLNQVVGVAAMCLQDEPDVRPLISDVVASLGFLASAPPEEPVPQTEMETLPNDHPSWPQSQSSKESHHDETDDSEESSEASESDDDEKSFDENHLEQKDDFTDEHSDGDLESESSRSSSDVEGENEQEKENQMTYSSTFGRINSLEYEVASMSSSSYSSDDDDDGHTNKTCDEPEFQGGNSSSRMKCKSTKIPKEERREGAITGSRRMSRKRSSALGSKGMNDMVLENENIGSYSRKISNAGESPLGHTAKRCDEPEFQGGNSSSRMKCKSTKIPKEERHEGAITGSRRMSRKRSSGLGSKSTNDGSYSKKSSNAGSDNAFYHEKNRSISSNSSRLSTSSDSSQSSTGGSGDDIEISGQHKDNEGLEDELL